MDLRQLTYFKAVAEGGSFARASSRLRIAQPAVSSQVSHLEQELGSQLFVRHTRGVSLTPAGITLLQHASEILKKVEQARTAVREISDDHAGVMTIGIPTTIANILAPSLVEAVRSAYPKLELQLVDALSGEINAWHAAGRFDLAVLYSTDGKPLPNTSPLFEEQLYLLGPTNSSGPLGKSIRFRELVNYPLYHTSRIHACRLLLDATAVQAGFSLNCIAEIDSIALLHSFVAQKGAFTIFPCSSIPSALQSQVQYRRIIEPDLFLKSYVACGVNRPDTKVRRAVLTILAQLSADLKSDNWRAIADRRQFA